MQMKELEAVGRKERQEWWARQSQDEQSMPLDGKIETLEKQYEQISEDSMLVMQLGQRRTMRHWLARVWRAVLAPVPQEWQVKRMGKGLGF
ncbi:hypothetical protein MRB53_035513 [Persea americana]|uniref:Uncharacterized protein n=1 Tax=Persea americana TaxID=3435 RepID=A0ACC2K4W1_PERAE|nr:hypothetical protein MRB53_035513 [Persea americana]